MNKYEVIGLGQKGHWSSQSQRTKQEKRTENYKPKEVNVRGKC